jgi:hypothetical protein
MKANSIFERPVLRAVLRARTPILTIALTQLICFCIGTAMVHSGSAFALESRDRLVTHGEVHDPAAIAFQQGKRTKAALIEFGRDVLRTVAKTLEGLTVVVPYPLAAYRGWYGGIVSVDSNHTSRIADPFDALYFLGFEILELIAASLAAGAGVNLVLGTFRPRLWYQGAKWLGVPKEALRDLGRIFLLAVALIFVASFWEYFFP